MESRWIETLEEAYINLCQIDASNNKEALTKAQTQFHQLINSFCNISLKKNEVRKLANKCHQLAISYFNSDNKRNAAHMYLQGINLLLPIHNKKDEDYRHLTELYTSLSDTCLHLGDTTIAAQHFSEAIRIFAFISDKTPEEKNIKDYKSFHDHYEKILSKDDYRESRVFKNHQELLYAKHDENCLEKTLSDLSVEEKKTSANTMECHSTNFNLLQPSEPCVSDENSRTMALLLIELGNKQLHQNLKNDALQTFKQVIDTFNSIKKKNETDYLYIKKLQEYLQQLSEEQKKSYNYSSNSVAAQLGVRIYHKPEQTVSGLQIQSTNQDEDESLRKRMEF